MIRKVRSYASLGTMGVLVALCALMAVVPAWAQALWSDAPSRLSSPEPQDLRALVFAAPRSYDQTITIQTYSNGPTANVPSSVVMPAGQGSIWVDFTVGPTVPNDRVILIFEGPTTMGEQDNWFE